VLNIDYWAPSQGLITGNALLADADMRIGNSRAELYLEMFPLQTKLGLRSSVSSKAISGVPVTAASFMPAEGSDSVLDLNACFVLWLAAAVPMSAEIASDLNNLTKMIVPKKNVGSKATGGLQWDKGVRSEDDSGTLESMILKMAGIDGIGQRAHVGRGFLQQWSLGNAGHRGVLVNRVPFKHISAIFPTLQLLRRQQVFNRLFLSCFEESATLNTSVTTEVSAQSVRSFELVADPVDMWLQVSTLHPVSGKLLALQISVTDGGSITLEVDMTQGSPALEKEALLLKVLTVSMDVPLAIDEAFN